jgi:hypothetical protein
MACSRRFPIRCVRRKAPRRRSRPSTGDGVRAAISRSCLQRQPASLHLGLASSPATYPIQKTTLSGPPVPDLPMPGSRYTCPAQGGSLSTPPTGAWGRKTSSPWRSVAISTRSCPYRAVSQEVWTPFLIFQLKCRSASELTTTPRRWRKGYVVPLDHLRSRWKCVVGVQSNFKVRKARQSGHVLKCSEFTLRPPSSPCAVPLSRRCSECPFWWAAAQHHIATRKVCFGPVADIHIASARVAYWVVSKQLEGLPARPSAAQLFPRHIGLWAGDRVLLRKLIQFGRVGAASGSREGAPCHEGASPWWVQGIRQFAVTPFWSNEWAAYHGRAVRE